MAPQETRIPYGSGRSAIIEAVIRLVAHSGLTGLTYRALAAEAGVSVGAIRHSFPTIDDVLGAALDHSLMTSLDAMAPATDLISMFETMYDAIEADPIRSAFEVKAMTEAQARPELAEIATHFYEGFAAYVRQLLRKQDIDPTEEMVEFALAFADGMNYQRVVFGEVGKTKMHQQIQGLAQALGLAKVSG